MPEITPLFQVCLVNPPVLGVLEPWYDTPSFGRTALAYLAGYLRQYQGFQIHIIDAKFERLSFDDVLNRIAIINPSVVGLTAFTNEIKPAAYQAALIKNTLPNTKIIVGGPHVTAIPKETLLEFSSFDIGAVGEGEITFYELCNALKNGEDFTNIRGLAIRENGGDVKITPPRERILDQDSIPFPAWDLLPKADTYFIQSIRGCPYNCLFCMNPSGKVPRKRSVANVIEELNLIIRNFNPKRISFGDELFSIDMQRTHELLDAMILNDIGKKVRWDVQTHVNYVDDELFKKFKKANVDRVELGIETGDETTLKKMGKGTSLKSIMNACNAAKKAKVPFGTFFLFGQPNETIQSLQKTVDLAVKINPDLPIFGLMTPYPGTEVAKKAANGEDGYHLLTTDWDQFNKQIGGAMSFANLNRRQIEWFQLKAYLKVYIYNRRFLDLIVFILQYRKAGWEILKKVIYARKKITKHLNIPANYKTLIYNNYTVGLDAFIESQKNWSQIQNNELKRFKSSEKYKLTASQSSSSEQV